MNHGTGETIRSLAQGRIDWPLVCQLAALHGIQPLFYRNLREICPETLPDRIAEQLHAGSRVSISRSLFQISELHRVFNIFSRQNIRAIAFKGPTLGDWAYGDPALRESGDLDIVVHRQDILAARKLLREHDYQEHSGEADATDVAASSQEAPRYNVFVHNESNITIDLQRSLEAPHFSFPLDDPGLWTRAVTRKLAGQSVASFCRDDLLILLCVHGTKDVWPQLKWICDVNELLRVDGAADWTRILGRANQLRARRRLLLGAFLAHSLLGAEVPDGILQETRKSRSLVDSANTIMGSLFEAEREITLGERVTLYFRTDDSTSQRAIRYARYIGSYLRVIFAPSDSDRMFVQLPKWLSFGYYVIRPIRLMFKFAARPRRLFRTLRDWFGSLG